MPVTSIFLDLPLLRGDEQPQAPHIVATAQPWPGSVAVYQSGTDANYLLNKILPIRATIGVTQNDLAWARAGVLDRGPGLQVQLTSGLLESVEDTALLSGANLAAIGDGSADQWEVFQFANADLIAPNTYWLTSRLRGQAGSDGLMPEVWPQGSQFVLLNGVQSQITLSPNLRRIVQHYRIGPAQRGYDDPSYSYRKDAFNGNGYRPYRPCHLRAAYSGAGDLDLSWVRRTRLNGDEWEGIEVPLGEETEQYLVRVLRDGQLIREAMTTTPAWTYTQTVRASDGIVAPFSVSVAQISANFGAGPAAHRLIPA